MSRCAECDCRIDPDLGDLCDRCADELSGDDVHELSEPTQPTTPRSPAQRTGDDR